LFARKPISFKDAFSEEDRLGIGLYSIYLLANRNNGIITYNDNEEGGAVFKMIFPISSDSEKQTKENSRN